MDFFIKTTRGHTSEPRRWCPRCAAFTGKSDRVNEKKAGRGVRIFVMRAGHRAVRIDVPPLNPVSSQNARNVPGTDHSQSEVHACRATGAGPCRGDISVTACAKRGISRAKRDINVPQGDNSLRYTMQEVRQSQIRASGAHAIASDARWYPVLRYFMCACPGSCACRRGRRSKAARAGNVPI